MGLLGANFGLNYFQDTYISYIF